MKDNPISIVDHDAARSALNRANASHSSDPKTEAGRQRSCLNAMRHALTGHTVVLSAENLVARADSSKTSSLSASSRNSSSNPSPTPRRD
jgi:hypothetical protein